MKRTIIFLSFILILAAVLYPSVRADAMSCDGGIITTGDRSSEVLAKCGPPDFKDSHQEEVIQGIGGNTRQKIFITVEEWTYELGSNQLIRIVTIKNGTVTNIQERRRP